MPRLPVSAWALLTPVVAMCYEAMVVVLVLVAPMSEISPITNDAVKYYRQSQDSAIVACAGKEGHCQDYQFCYLKLKQQVLCGGGGGIYSPKIKTQVSCW